MGTRLNRRHPQPPRGLQRGVALLVMVTVIALGATWLFVTALSNASSRNALNRQDNARVLAEAKQAVVGWVIRQAIEAGENNPGRLPCPEAAGYIGTANEGIAAGNCTLPAVGRLPWRTLGLPKLLDSSGEPLWYVVSPGWALPTVVSTLTINSDSPGQLTVDAAASAAVALIISPGPALNVQASAGCSARAQARNALAPDFRDYLECENAASPADASFVTNGPTGSFNDQVVALTTRDVLPGLEAAIMKRIEREIVPQLKALYAGPEWGTSTTSPVFPFPAQFDTSAAATFQGDLTIDQGLLPVNYYSASCGTDPRCSSTFVSWSTPIVSKVSGSGTVNPPTCGPSGSWIACSGTYTGSAEIQMTDILANVANTLPPYDASTIPSQNGVIYYYNSGWIQLSAAATTLTRGFSSSDASFRYNVKGVLPDIGGLGQYVLYAYRPAFATYALLDPNDPVTGWFIRNEWYRLAYYVVAPGQTAASSTCSVSSTNCLSLTRAGVQEDNKRALLLLAGRRLANQTRPSSALANYLDTPENNDPTGYPPSPATATPYLFEQPRIDSGANDRVIVVDQN
jgi:hypothetical protein